MNRILTAALTGLVALPLAIAAGPQNKKPSHTESSTDDGKGNKSWSSSSSYSWGDPPPAGSAATKPFGPPGAQGFGAPSFGPPPNMKQGFYPGWNMPMDGFPQQSFSSSNNRFSLRNVSLLQALATLQDTIGKKILLTKDASSVVLSGGV